MKETAKEPIIGHGVGSSEAVIEYAKDWSGGTSLPHNDYLLHALEFGLIGLLLYLGLIFTTIKALFKSYKTATNNFIQITLGKINIAINQKILSYGVLIIFIALQTATMFESVSREIILEIVIWAIIGSLLAQNPKTSPTKTLK